MFRAWRNFQEQQAEQGMRVRNPPTKPEQWAEVLLNFALVLDNVALKMEELIENMENTDDDQRELIVKTIEADYERMCPLWIASMFWDLRRHSKQYEEQRQAQDSKMRQNEFDDIDLRRIHNLYDEYKKEHGEECHGLYGPQEKQDGDDMKGDHGSSGEEYRGLLESLRIQHQNDGTVSKLSDSEITAIINQFENRMNRIAVNGDTPAKNEWNLRSKERFKQVLPYK